MHVQLDLVEGRQAVVAPSGQAAHLQARLTVVPQRLLAVDAEGGPADHHPRQLALVGVTGGGAHHLAPAHDRDTVADGADLTQLVADEDDREAFVDEAAQRLEERVHLLRHEHGRGLVEDEHPAVAGERLDDLHALLLADRELRDDGLGPYGDAEPVGGLLHRAAGSFEVEPRPRGRPRMTFSVTVMGWTRLKCWVTMPMPAAMASRGAWMVTGVPSTRVVPASAVVSP